MLAVAMVPVMRMDLWLLSKKKELDVSSQSRGDSTTLSVWF